MRACCAEHKAQSLILLASFAGMPPCRYQSHGLGKEGRKNVRSWLGKLVTPTPGISQILQRLCMQAARLLQPPSA